MSNPAFTNNEEKSREWSARHILGDESQQKKAGPLDWWYRLSAPPPAAPTASLAEREVARRGRLTSLVLLGAIVIATFLAIPVVALQNPMLAPGIAGLDALFFIAVWFNHRGRINVAGVIVLISAMLGIPASIITAPGGLSTNSVPLYDLMIQSELFAISLLPAPTVFLVAAINCAFIVLDFNLQPHTADLNALIAKAGAEVLARPIILQVLVAVVIYLWVRSALQAIARADRAEVIAILEHDIAEQEHAIAEQKRQLDLSIQQIVETHNRVSNGDISARIPLTRNNVLWEIAGSLNNLLSRFQRALQGEQKLYALEKRLQWAKQIEHELKYTRNEVMKQAEIVRQAKNSHKPVRFVPTRTMLDPLLAEVNEASFTKTTPLRVRLTQKMDSDYSS